MSKGLIAVIVIVLIALVVGGQYVGVRNTLVTKNESVRSAWSQVGCCGRGCSIRSTG